MKSKLSLFLFVTLMIALLATGCGQAQPPAVNAETSASTAASTSAPTTAESTMSASKMEEGSIVTPVGQFPIVSEPVTLTFFAPQVASLEDISTNSFTKWYEDRTGVHIEWNLAPSNEFEEKRNLVLASGDYPDVFLSTGSIGADNEMKYGTEQGILIPVNDLIDEWCPNMVDFMDQIKDFRKAITNLDGNIYGFPGFNSCYHCEHAQRMWINSEWLDALGLSMPTTTDELYDVLKAFKTQDPNGNGQSDEIPFTSCISGSWFSDIDGFIMNSFIYSTASEGNMSGLKLRIDANGTVDSITNKEDYREGLRYLNKLYSEGLLDENALTQSIELVKSLLADPDNAIVGMIPGGTMMSYVDTVINNETYARFHALAPLKGPTGLQQSPEFPSMPASGQTVITIACKYPEVVARWTDDFFCSTGDDAYLTAVSRQFGVEGTDWRWGQEGEFGLDGVTPAMYQFITVPDQPSQNHCWANAVGPYIWSEAMRSGMPSDPTKSLYAADMVDPLLYDASKKLMEPTVPKDFTAMPPIKYTSDESTEMATLEVELKKYLGESVAKFISGDMSLDADWDNYIANLENIGLSKYIEIVQTGYTRQYK